MKKDEQYVIQTPSGRRKLIRLTSDVVTRSPMRGCPPEPMVRVEKLRATTRRWTGNEWWTVEALKAEGLRRPSIESEEKGGDSTLLYRAVQADGRGR